MSIGGQLASTPFRPGGESARDDAIRPVLSQGWRGRYRYRVCRNGHALGIDKNARYRNPMVASPPHDASRT